MRDRGNRDRIVLATKCAGAMGAGAERPGALALPHPAGGRREPAPAADRRHRPVPGARVRPARRRSRRRCARSTTSCARGKVRYIGCSNYPAWRLGEALATSERLGIARYDCLQPRYNLLYRDIETELLPLARDRGARRHRVQPAGRRLPLRQVPQGRDAARGHALHAGRRRRACTRQRYWHDAQFDAMSSAAARLSSSASMSDGVGGCRVGDRAAGDHVGDRRREPRRSSSTRR